MPEDTLLIRAVASVAGMRPGEIARRPTVRAKQLIAAGYATEVSDLAARRATEQHTRPMPMPYTSDPDVNPIPTSGTVTIPIGSDGE